MLQLIDKPEYAIVLVLKQILFEKAVYQAFWYYKMVRFCPIDLKLHPVTVTQFTKNRIIHKKMHNIHKTKHKSTIS